MASVGNSATGCAPHRQPSRASIVGEGDRVVVWLCGEHDISTVGLVSTTLVQAIAVHDLDVVVDLREVEFMDASTVGALVNGRNLLAARGRRLLLRFPSSSLRRLLELCDVEELIEIEPPGTTPGGAATALETWVEVPPTGGGTTERSPSRSSVNAAGPRTLDSMRALPTSGARRGPRGLGRVGPGSVA